MSHSLTTTLALTVTSVIAQVGFLPQANAQPNRRPNVILIMTDDQGYGDVGAHDNKDIKTPNLDRLSAESVCLTNFHVDPTCSPTRAALLTGRYSIRTGVWHTIQGRSMLDGKETTLAEALKRAGYATGIFGKWHLGDAFPCRPQDQGFDEVLTFGDGAISGINDYFGNDYFDDHYLHNGEWEPFAGYCTDVWFDQAIEWIGKQKDRPFFCYIPTNAPHWPFLVAEKYHRPYADAGKEKSHAAFWGMITNIDDNVGRLMVYLDSRGLTENTIVIFMTDNGSAAGWMEKPSWKTYSSNAGMRGFKGSAYDGGHRVPFFIRWPAGGIGGDTKSARAIDALTAHIDLMPTLLNLCGVQTQQTRPFDGVDLSAILRDQNRAQQQRTLVVHSQRIERPRKWRESAVMTARYRLVHRTELYDMTADPGQQQDVAPQHPEVVTRLQQAYERWWSDVSGGLVDVAYIIGDDRANPTLITTHDLHSDKPDHDGAPWHQNSVKRGSLADGFYLIDVAKAGRYRFTLRRWPSERPRPTGASRAIVRVGQAEAHAACDPSDETAVVELTIPRAGRTRLQADLVLPNGDQGAALFVEIERLAG